MFAVPKAMSSLFEEMLMSSVVPRLLAATTDSKNPSTDIRNAVDRVSLSLVTCFN